MKEIRYGEYIELSPGDYVKVIPPKCYLCDNEGVYRYACYDFETNWSEEKRWRCKDHQPYHATDEGWNGEWDDFSECVESGNWPTWLCEVI